MVMVSMYYLLVHLQATQFLQTDISFVGNKYPVGTRTVCFFFSPYFDNILLKRNIDSNFWQNSLFKQQVTEKRNTGEGLAGVNQCCACKGLRLTLSASVKIKIFILFYAV
jgi:hypothetical protein